MMTWPDRPTQTHEATEQELALLAKYGHLFKPMPEGFFDTPLNPLPSTVSAEWRK